MIQQNTSRKTIIVEIVALIVLALFFFMSVQRGSPPNNEADIAAPPFVPPVYGVYGNERFVTLPFLIEETASQGVLSEEQKHRVNEFKKNVLARAVSQIPFDDSEKDIILASISTSSKIVEDGFVVADQNILQFTENELRLIKEKLQK
ncbi:MAG: hypothetical protein UX81_C0010G0034 [Parcubacteria group bacterium GW2011_GWA2_47_12]|nr:MAG: hypothetical protein UX81_C0010G0034 [Parcubacteria group bacterium GW2011_GWA2_47_12]